MKTAIYRTSLLTLLTAISILPATAQPRTRNLGDTALLDLVERQTFHYFWDGAEPNSGMAAERVHMDNDYPEQDQRTIATGGSGFGAMAILAAIRRHYITREQGLARFEKIVSFLQKADRFHGAFPHWLNDETAHVKPFGRDDDGGDLVETCYLMQGLLCVRQYFSEGSAREKALASRIDTLWRDVDFNWYRNGDQNVLFWHWSPTHGWKMNFPIHGYNECLILYVMAASSPTHPVPAAVYDEGWAQNGAIDSISGYKNDTLHLHMQGNPPHGGPLFWSQYSYLGLDPRGLRDKYADYWKENKTQTLINYAWCVDNPKHFQGYGRDNWGLTASYSVAGYAAHAPDEKNDLGVISPTAAISAIAYTPKQSIAAIRFWYEHMQATLWGKYGFYDAFSQQSNWHPPRYLAIDQGTEVAMIENYRSALLWRLFMSCQEVQGGLKKLGFESPWLNQSHAAAAKHPAAGELTNIPPVGIIKGLSDSALLDVVQRQTFRYFWDFAHPVSGLARERDNTVKAEYYWDFINEAEGEPNFSKDTFGPEACAIGGTGFGILSTIVATQRKWIGSDTALRRLVKIVDFLTKADCYHGIYPHFMNGATGKTIPFGRLDDGADIVETSYLLMGLLCARQYFNGDTPLEIYFRNRVAQMWSDADWSWHSKGDNKRLYWHWSPNNDFNMNFPVYGWDEALITYVLAASSPTHGISKELYESCWVNSASWRNGKSFYGIRLPLGNFDYGGPLFFEQYTFMGVNPNGLKDDHDIDYAEQTRNHTLINRAWCIENPKKFKGYGENCWGLTAGDSYKGYVAHCPQDDRGVIQPTAALSSFPYTPEYSMKALRHFYYDLGDSIWGPYGFADGFSESKNWYAKTHLAIDQGPIIVMIENYRSGLIWDLFMQIPDVLGGLQKLGFTTPTQKNKKI
jgi:hypothetical protein